MASSMVEGRLVGNKTRAVELTSSTRRLRGVLAGVGSMPGAIVAEKRRRRLEDGAAQSESESCRVESKGARRVERGERSC